ncbi:MAG: MBL fold metallo-hydrolase [Spirochaeta sp.]|jgi:hydroxyacylglutathione hydrolase|nr:MBL fold metallo-hydrolase [Spirochaeta sp.]
MLIDRVIVGSLHTNAYIVSIGKKECIIIDPGDESDTLVKRLEAMNLIPLAIVFTHGHIDHTSATQGIIDYYAGRGHHVSVGIHEADAQFLGPNADAANYALFEVFGAPGLDAYKTYNRAVPEAEFYFSDGDTVLDSDITVMHTPGHSAGSTCFYSEPREAVFTGDTLFFNTIGRSDFPSGEPELVHQAVTERIFTLPQNTRVFPGHGPLSSVEREVRNNPMESEGATI